MSRRSPARVVAGFLALLFLLALSPASQAQKVFLKTTNPTGLPQEFLSQFVDMAVGPDGSSYYLFDLMGTRNNVVLDQTTFGFGRSLGTYVAKMSPSGDWLWAAAFEGNATKLDLRCLAVGTDFLVVGGSYVKSDAAQTATWKGSVGAAKVISPVDEPVLPVTPTTGGVDGMPQRVEQGLFLKLDLDGNYLSSHVLRNCTLGISIGFAGIAPSTVNLASSLTASAITSVAIGSGGTISAAGYTAPALTDLSLGGFNYHTALLGKSTQGRTAWLFCSAESLADLRHRRVPFLGGYDASFKIRWAYQFLGEYEGFKTWADAQANPSMHGRIDRIRLDTQGNTIFAGRITAGGLANGRNATAEDRAGVLSASLLFLSQSGGTSAGYSWPLVSFASIQSVLGDGVAASYRVFNSYVIGRLDKDGQLTGVNLDPSSGTNVMAESALTDLVLTDNGGYAAGWVRGSGLEANPHLNTAEDLSGLTRLMPNASATRSRTDDTRLNAFALRFSTFESRKLTVQNWAFLRNEAWTDPVTCKGLGIEVLPDGRVAWAVGNKTGVGLVEFGTRSAGGAITTKTNEVNLRAARQSTDPNSGLHSLLLMNSDLSYSGDKVVPENLAPLPGMMMDGRDEAYRQGLGLGDVRLGLSSKTGFLMWAGLTLDGDLTLGKGDAASAISARTASRPYVTALDLNRAGPRGEVLLAEQVTVSIKSGLPPSLRDGTQVGRPAVTTLMEPAASSLVRLRGTPLTIRVPYQVLTDVERVASSGLPVAGNPSPLLYEKLATVADTPKSLKSYIDAGQWPNYPRTRYTFKNFRVEDRVQAGTEPVFTLVLDQNTTIGVDYAVDHALDTVAIVAQETATEQLVSDEQQRLLGNPTYSTDSGVDENLDVGTAVHPGEAKTAWKWGRSWVPKGNTVQIDVGVGSNLVLPLGERFVSSRYTLRNTTESTRAPDPNQPDGVAAFTVPSFAMNEPQELEFYWRKQIQIQMGPLTEEGARDSVFLVKGPSSPITANSTVASRSVTRPFRGLDATSGASSWIDYGLEVAIAAASAPSGGLQLNGWLVGNGHFAKSQGDLSDLRSTAEGLDLGVRSSVQEEIPMPGASLVLFKWVSPAAHYLLVPKLTQPTFVVWNYGGFLFKEYTAIGRAVEGALINGSGVDSRGNSYASRRPGPIVNAAPTVTVVDGPPGTTPENALAWDPVKERLFPLRPGRYLARFATRDASPADGEPSRPLIVEVTSGFPGDFLKDRITSAPDTVEAAFRFPLLGAEWVGAYREAHYRHIAGAPGVVLDGDPADGFAFRRLAYFESRTAESVGGAGSVSSAATVENGRFQNRLAGKSVLVFSRAKYAENADGTLDVARVEDPASFPATGNTEREPLMVRVVESRSGTTNTAAWSPSLANVFDGSNRFVAIPASSFPFPGSQSFTFSTWFRTELGRGGVILGQQGSGVAPFGQPGGYVPALYVGTDGLLRASLFFNGTSSLLTTPFRVDDAGLHHVAVVHQSNEQTLYVDGVEVGRRSHTQTAYGNGVYVYQLGTGFSTGWPSTSGGWYDFRGSIDAPKIELRPWSGADVAAEFAGVVRSIVEIGNPQAIGQPVASPLDTANLGTGWILNESPKLLVHPGIYNREEVKGPIIPVNRRLPGDKLPFEDELVVVWYEDSSKLAAGREPRIAWPYQPERYDSDRFFVPFGVEKDYLAVVNPAARRLDPRANILYSASRLGSDGLKKSAGGTWEVQSNLLVHAENVRIYQQPDRNAAGYNPNEEHALVAPAVSKHATNDAGAVIPASIVARTDGAGAVAVFALRDDYNYGLRRIARDAGLGGLDPGSFAFTAEHKTQFTSDPYVLVEYVDTTIGEPRMAVCLIGHESDIYRFRYPVTVAQPVKAPYPVDTLTGFGVNDSRQIDNLDDPATPAALDGRIDGTYFVNASAGAMGTAQAVWWMDPAGTAWAISGPVQRKDDGGGLVPDSFTVPHFYGGFFYNLRADFWHPDAVVVAGDPIAWLPGLVNSNGDVLPPTVNGPQGVPTPIRYDTVWPDNLPILKVGETLTYAGGEFKADNPTRIVGGEPISTPGLPGVIGWAAGQVLFDSANPAMSLDNVSAFTVRLVNPLAELSTRVALNDVAGEDSGFQASNAAKIAVRGGSWIFPELSASLQKRVSYDPTLQKLTLRGYVSDRSLGDPALTAAPDPVYVLEPNVLTVAEAREVASLFVGPSWSAAVNRLYNLSRDPNGLATDSDTLPVDEIEADVFVPYMAGLGNRREPNEATGDPGSIYFDENDRAHAAAVGPGLAVVPNDDLVGLGPDRFAEGFVTLVENAHPDKPNLGPITLHVVKLEREQRYRGAIKTVLSRNVFDEKIVVRHTADFGGNLDDVEYEWWYTPAVTGDVGSPEAPTPLSDWKRIPNATENVLRLQGDPTLLLGDMLFFCRYKHVLLEPSFGPAIDTPFPWQWAGAGNSPQLQADGSKRYLPQLVMGWVKRVLDRVNPYEARFGDFGSNDAPATYSSLVQQAGAPPRGPVALNPDKNVVENVGLIELYQTILDRAVALSIGLDQPAANASIWQALMLAGTRINQLYTILGNEAYSDAQDPTIGASDARLAPVWFSFQNQMATLLHEELALLRGTDYSKGWPVDNRLFWNFVKGDGEPAYVSNYGIKDVNSDGFIDEKDGKVLFPQGHGDAWGHYLSASKAHYSLLRHPHFAWRTFSELYNLLDVVIEADFLDEVTFARTASAKARAGLEIVKNTYRLNYEQDPDGQWQGYTDTDKARAWGVTEWATRAYHGAYFDWVVGNALLPFRAVGPDGLPSDGSSDQLDKIDRVSVTEWVDTAVTCSRIQGALDEANVGIHPLGVSRDAVPFDLDPNFYVIGSGTQLQPPFEQIYQRARQAGVNAVNAFQFANELENRLRDVAASTEDLRRLARDQDISYRNQLIELFGTPYDGLIGPGGLYPPGYEGPDLLLFRYIQWNEIGDYLPNESQAFKDLFTQELYGSYRTSLTDAQRALFGSFGIPNSGFTLKDLIEGFTRLDVVGADPSDPFLASFYGRFASGKDFTIRSTKSESDPSVFPQLDDSGEGKGLISFNIPVDAEAVHGFRAEPNWGQRRATGAIQAKLQELVQAQIALRSAVNEYEGVPIFLRAALHEQQATFKDFAGKLEYETAVRALDRILAFARTIKENAVRVTSATSKTVDETYKALAEAFPKVVGVAVDATSGARAALFMAASASRAAFDGVEFGFDVAFDAVDFASAVTKDAEELKAMAREFKAEQRQFVHELIQLLAEESTRRYAIAEAMASVVQRQQELDALIAQGFRLVGERELANQRLAADTQQHRYSDALLRANRNDALQRYLGSLDLALRYGFLAARYFDYETNFDPAHPASSAPLLAELVRTRTLGLWVDGQPQIGQGGLAEILAKLRANYDATGIQLGFNNPHLEVGRFSLRHEWARIKPDESSHIRWRQVLQARRVDDLRLVPEFQRYCRPFAPASAGPQPGLVIPLGTEITEGRNFFGHPLGGMDHAYDPTQFATKIRAVGVWFTGYDGTGLSLTPRVYLVPAGSDVMLVPDSPTLQRRVWNVVDQKIPVPFPLGAKDLRNPDWIVGVDGLNGSFADMQKFSRFRAFPDFLDSDEFPNETEMTRDSRLVGRSVWNTKWVLIIPGATLHADPKEGLDRFIGSDADSGVTDIKLLFETYAHSGR